MPGFSKNPAHSGFVKSCRIPNRRDRSFRTRDVENAGLLLQFEREVVKLLDGAERRGELKLLRCPVCRNRRRGPGRLIGDPRRRVRYLFPSQVSGRFLYGVQDLRVLAADLRGEKVTYT